VNPKRILDSPEILMTASAFFLNFFWEMAQSPLYEDINRKSYSEILLSRLHCTLGDVLILLGAYWIVTWWAGDRYWVIDFRVRDVMVFTVLGLGYTSEWVNIDIRSAWGYAAAMPRVPWISTGLAPLIQWLFLPPLIAGVTRRLVQGRDVTRIGRL